MIGPLVDDQGVAEKLIKALDWTVRGRRTAVSPKGVQQVRGR